MTAGDTEIYTPNWVHDAIFYQIFPDRFAKSERVEKPGGLEPWDSDPTAFGYKGGDLLGVVEHLDYLTDLGITALYFNPIFQSASNHRYHTHDYYQVDPLLGGNDAFDEMLKAAHERGLKVVLDGVFNHASRGFFQFNDVLENGAASPWRDWFEFYEFPANAYDHNRKPGYRAWVGLHALPAFNTDNPQVREYIMRIGEHWMRKGIDGWRLDVPFEITTEGFWAEFRQRMRAINPEAYIVGEIWSNPEPWLQGDQFDATMNYVFAGAVLAFTGRDRVVPSTVEGRDYDPIPPIGGCTYRDRIERLLTAYPWPIELAQLNLLDSHDTSRALSVVGGDLRSLELALLLLFTYPGAPSIYYGSEIGLTGALPPDRWARRTFPWDDRGQWNMDLLDYTTSLIAMRKAHPSLRTGTYESVGASDASYALRRKLDGDAMLVVVNTSDESDALELAVDGSGSLVPVLSLGGEATIDLHDSGARASVPPRSGTVFQVNART